MTRSEPSENEFTGALATDLRVRDARPSVAGLPQSLADTILCPIPFLQYQPGRLRVPELVLDAVHPGAPRPPHSG